MNNIANMEGPPASPDPNDMSWDFTEAYNPSSATSPPKRTFERYLIDHPDPLSVPTRPRHPVDPFVSIHDTTDVGNVSPWYKKLGVAILNCVSSSAQRAKQGLVAVTRRRLPAYPQRYLSRLFRQLEGQNTTTPITPSRFRPFSRYRIPGTYPPSPSQAEALPPTPPGFPMVPTQTPPPVPAVARPATTTTPGSFPESPEAPVIAYSTPPGPRVFRVPSPSPSPSPVPPATTNTTPPSPSPVPLVIANTTPPGPRVFRVPSPSPSLSPVPPATVNTTPPSPSPSSAPPELPQISVASPSALPIPVAVVPRPLPAAVIELRKIREKFSSRKPVPDGRRKRRVHFADQAITSERVLSPRDPSEASSSNLDNSSPSLALTTSKVQHARESIESNRSSSDELPSLSQSPIQPGVVPEIEREEDLLDTNPSMNTELTSTSSSTLPAALSEVQLVDESIGSNRSSSAELPPQMLTPMEVENTNVEPTSEVQHARESIESNRSSSAELPSQSQPLIEAETMSEVQHVGESIGSNRSSSAELPPQMLTLMEVGITNVEPTSEVQHVGESIELNRSSSAELSPLLPCSMLAAAPSEMQPEIDLIDLSTPSPKTLSPEGPEDHRSLREASPTPNVTPIGVSGLAMLRQANSIRVSSNNRSPLLTRYAQGNSQRIQWPTVTRKSVSFLPNPVSGVKKYAKGERISYPSPTSTLDENSILSVDAGSGAQWSSPTQADQDAFLQAQIREMSPIPSIRGTLSGSSPLPIPANHESETNQEPDLSSILVDLALGPNPADRRKSQRGAKKAEEEAALAREQAEKEKKAREAAEEKEKKARGYRQMPIEKVIRPLSTEWEAKIAVALSKPFHTEVATSVTATPISRKDIGRVLPQPGRDPASGWLNDEIVNAYLQAVVQYGNEKAGHRRGQTPKFHAFNPFFWSNLNDFGPEKVARWAGKAKFGGAALSQVEQVYIPVNRGGNHWTMLIISPKRQVIEYFDSFHGDATAVIQKARAWIAQELKKEYHEEQWKVAEDPAHVGRGKGPTQYNGSDCGVFAVTTAKMVSLGVDPMAITAGDMALQRKNIVAEIMNGGFVGDFEPNIVFA